MALNDVVFVKGVGGLGRPLAGKDFYSALLFFAAALPSGFTSADNIKKLTSVADADNLGIKSTGVTPQIQVMRYHIAEYFRMQPQGVLYVGIYAVPAGAYGFTEIQTMQNFANGEIRQIGIYKDAVSGVQLSDITAIDGVCKSLDAAHKNISAVLAVDISAVTDLTTLPDLSTLNANKVSVVISQDGAGAGATLAVAYGKSVGNLGALLGTIAAAKVNESVSWVGKFNASNGTENDTPAMANGQLVSKLSDSLLGVLNASRYVFLRKYVGYAGSYWNDSHTAIVSSSDYAYIENNRTIDKAIRGLYLSMLPDLGSPLLLKADGTLSDISVAALLSDARRNLDQMLRDGEISTYGVNIDTTQNVASTSKVTISVKDIPVGVARNIEVDIMNAAKL